MWNTVLFDLDGTLTDSGEGITKCVQYALRKEFNIVVDDLRDLDCFVGPPLKEQFMQYAGLTEEEGQRAVRAYRERYRTRGIYENRLYDGILPLLKQLAAEGMTLAVSSSKPTEFCREILRYFGIEPYFRVIVGSELSGERTKKAEVLEETLRRLGMQGSRQCVVLVGDRKYDVEGAKEAGISSIGVTYGYGSRAELEKAWPDAVVDNPEELRNVLIGQYRDGISRSGNPDMPSAVPAGNFPQQPLNPYGYPYGYAPSYGAQPEVQQQYGGQAYGYQGQAQQYGFAAQNQAQSIHDYGRAQQLSGGSARTVMQKARRRVKSPLFFLVVLLHTILTVASILNLVTGNVLYNLNVMQNSLQKTVGNNLAVTYMNTVIDLIEGASKTTILGVDFALCLPSVLVCLGLWLMFIKTTVSKEEISTGGYTLTKVMTLLQFIAICLVLTAGLIFSVAFVVAAGAGGTVATIIAGIILLVIMILFSVLTILFFVQLLHALKVIKWNAKNGTDKGRISTYVPVIGILLSIATGLSMIPMAPNDYIGLANQAASAAWMLFGSIWLLVYRAKVRR